MGNKFGIALDENGLSGTVAWTRQQYERLATALAADREYHSIERAAPNYMSVFKMVARDRQVKGDVIKLKCPHDNLDVLFCAEVLEHGPALQKFCNGVNVN